MKNLSPVFVLIMYPFLNFLSALAENGICFSQHPSYIVIKIVVMTHVRL